MGRRALVLVSLLAASGFVPAIAHAGGFEYIGAGTRAFGRGGAFMARADDPMALGYNPAALAFLPGYQLMLGSHLAFYDACVQRSGGYDDTNVSGTSIFDSRFGTGSDPWVQQSFPQVCRGGYPGPSPQLVFTGRVLPELGFGVGILAPSGVGNGTWGNMDGTIEANGMTLPTPTRYALVHQDLLLFHPTVGIGWSPVEWLSIGVSFQWGIAMVTNINHTNAGMGPEDPAQDVRTVLQAEDFFVPAVIFSAHFVPIDALDVVLTARLSDGIDAGASLNLTTGWFGTGQEFSLVPQETSLTGVRLQAGQPLEFGLGVRYADRREERRYRDHDQAERITGRIQDPMQTENWDIELDITYLHNGTVRDFVVTPPPGASVGVCEGPLVNGMCSGRVSAPLPNGLPLPHGWADQVSVRLGGDWNVIPGTLALRLGSHFESSGFSTRYQIQDFVPGMRLGLHAGVTLRVERFDFSFAYGHIFQFTESTADANFRMIAATGSEGQCAGAPAYDPAQPVTSRGCYPQGAGSVVNAATYTGDFNVISAQVGYHF